MKRGTLPAHEKDPGGGAHQGMMAQLCLGAESTHRGAAALACGDQTTAPRPEIFHESLLAIPSRTL